MAWLGLPGEGLGGMNPRAGDAVAVDASRIDFSPDAGRRCDGVPIQVWSTKSFTARWQRRRRSVPAGRSDRRGSGSRRARSPTRSTSRWSNCILAYGRSVYELGTIEPGESVRLGTDDQAERVEDAADRPADRLRAKTATSTARRPRPTTSRAPTSPYILRTMMFYEAAGGRRYTRPVERLSAFRRSERPAEGRPRDPRGRRPATPASDSRGADAAPRRPAAGRHARSARHDVPVRVPGEEGESG